MPTEIALLPFLLVPLLTGTLLFFRSFLSPSSFRVSNFWTLVSACSVAAAICLSVNLSWLERYPDTRLGVFAFLSQFVLLPVDWIGLSWCGMSAALTWLILSWPSGSEKIAPTLREHFAGLWMCALSALTVFASDVWLQWGGTVGTGWLLCLILARDDDKSKAATGAGLCLLWLTVADFIWMFGLLMFQLVWVTPQVGFLTNWEYLQGLTLEQTALAVTAQMLMLTSLVLRCGLYPLMTWTRHAALSDRSAAWIIVFGLGQGLMIFFRWTPMFHVFEESRLLMAGFGALSTVLLGILAVLGSTGPRRLVCLTSGGIGLVWMGQATDLIQTGLPIVSFGFSLLAFATCLTLGCEGTTWGFKSSVQRPVLLVLAMILCSGLLGQEFLVNELFHVGDLKGISPWGLVSAALVGHLLATTALFRELNSRDALLRTDTNSPEDADDTAIPVIGWLGLGLFGPVIAVVILFLPWFLGGSIPSIPGFPILCLVTMAIGIVIARTWPDGVWSDLPEEAEQSGVLRRLAVNDFYVPRVVKLLTRTPARTAAQVFHFFDWFFLGTVVQKFPERVIHRAADAAALVDEDATESDAVWQVLGALACLLIGLGLSGVL